MPSSMPAPATPVVPEPYNTKKQRTQDKFIQIHNNCGKWPWELLESCPPEKWSQSMVERLAQAVKAVCKPESNVTMPELIDYLIQEAAKEGQPPQHQHKHSMSALKWIEEKGSGNKDMSRFSPRATRRRASKRGNPESTDANESLELPAPGNGRDMMDLDHQHTPRRPANVTHSAGQRFLQSRLNKAPEIRQDELPLQAGQRDSASGPESVEDEDDGDNDDEGTSASNGKGDDPDRHGSHDDGHNAASEEEQLRASLESCRDRLRRFRDEIRNEEQRITNFREVEQAANEVSRQKERAICHADKLSVGLEDLRRLVNDRGDALPASLRDVVSEAEGNFHNATLAVEKAEAACKEGTKKLERARQAHERAERTIAIYQQDIEIHEQEERNCRVALLGHQFRRLEEDNFSGVSPDGLSRVEHCVQQLLANRDGKTMEDGTEDGDSP
ncbi:hypothetical protein FDECE_8845 [Fusarium decemcellulare]|nr:hypothetical protein FDECE_8845 [Fusarium decemcellulare]